MEIKANDYSLSEIIKIIREWEELSQEEFAKKINKSYGAIVKYENGQREPSYSIFVEICKRNNIEVIIKKKWFFLLLLFYYILFAFSLE